MKNFKSGHFIKALSYKAFQPTLINRAYHFDDGELMPLLEKANLKLGQLDAYSELVPDIDHFIRLHVVKEATVSSKIEGTQTSIEDVLLKEEEIVYDKRNDWREVNNYIKAMNEALSGLDKLPISSRLFKQAHATLLQGVRGEHKQPGEFRHSQNWIGGATLNDAVFIPPVWQEVDNLMSDLEKFLHNENTNIMHILKIAIAHYQFETIHPFCDGNGRIGRLMITLYFIENKVLSKPVLYLSDFFEKHRIQYYDNLMGVRLRSDLRQWLKFFIVGVIETADKGIKGLKHILTLKEDCLHNRLPKLGKKMHVAQTLLNYLFMNPVVRPNEIVDITGLSRVSSYKLLENFQELNILTEITGGQRNCIYIFSEYYEIFK